MAVKKVSKKKKAWDLSEVKGVKVTTPKFVTAFPKLFKPEAYQEGSKPAYSCVAIFQADQDIKELKSAIIRAKKEAFGPDKTKWPDISTPIKNGDEMEGYAGFEGNQFINMKTYNKPLIIDRSKEKIEDESEIYPGVIGRAIVVMKAVESGGKYYISCYLQGFQKVEDGESLAGGASASDFEDLEDDEDLDEDSEDSDDDDDSDDDSDDDDE